MRVLVIGSSAGETLPDQADEIAGVVRDLPGAVPLFGDVRERDILETIQTRGPFDGLIISAHGDPAQGIALSDGHLSAAALAAYINRAAAKWIVLSACYGEGLITMLLMATAADVLAASQEIDDRDAWRITRTLAQELQQTGGDLRATVEKLTPAALSPMRFYANNKRDRRPATERIGSDFMDYQPPQHSGRIEEALDAIRRELASLAQKVALLEYKVSQFHGNAGGSASQTTWIIVLAAIVIAGAAFSILAIYILRATLP